MEGWCPERVWAARGAEGVFVGGTAALEDEVGEVEAEDLDAEDGVGDGGALGVVDAAAARVARPPGGFGRALGTEPLGAERLADDLLRVAAVREDLRQRGDRAGVHEIPTRGRVGVHRRRGGNVRVIPRGRPGRC